MKKIPLFFPLILVLPALVAAPSYLGAQSAGDNEGEMLTLYAGEMKEVPTNHPSRVVIGNPAVADIISVDPKVITVAGKGAGMTNLLWWDGSGERSMRIKVLTEEMAYLKARIDSLLKDMGMTTVYTKPADAEGKVLLLGSVKTSDDVKRITTALGENVMKKTVNLVSVDEEESAVEMDVEVLEVDTDGTRQLGIEWPSAMTFNEPGDLDKSLRKTPDAFFHLSKWTRSAMNMKINFLLQEGKARLLSSPKLACQSGKEAELLVGGETPILTSQAIAVTGTSSSTSTTVEYKEYGIKLKFAPVITADGKVKMTINVEVSDIGVQPFTLGPADAPTALAFPLTKRNTSTQLVMNDGQTLAISGLIRQVSSEDVKKVPFLGNLPIVGLMFRSRDTKTGKGSGERGNTELVVIVTPKIIKNTTPGVKAAIEEKAAEASKPALQELKEEMKPEPAAPAVGQPAAQPVTSVPAPGAVSLDDYVRQVTEYISGKIVYPSAAKRSGIQGTVKLDLHVSRSGELLESVISKPSGNPILDADALSTSRDIAPYPGFPDSISEKDLWIQVPISYRLTKK